MNETPKIEVIARDFGYSFNRTFMELKQVANPKTYAQMRVLIGPSWN